MDRGSDSRPSPDGRLRSAPVQTPEELAIRMDRVRAHCMLNLHTLGRFEALTMHGVDVASIITNPVVVYAVEVLGNILTGIAPAGEACYVTTGVNLVQILCAEGAAEKLLSAEHLRYSIGSFCLVTVMLFRAEFPVGHTDDDIVVVRVLGAVVEGPGAPAAPPAVPPADYRGWSTPSADPDPAPRLPFVPINFFFDIDRIPPTPEAEVHHPMPFTTGDPDSGADAGLAE